MRNPRRLQPEELRGPTRRVSAEPHYLGLEDETLETLLQTTIVETTLRTETTIVEIRTPPKGEPKKVTIGLRILKAAIAVAPLILAALVALYGFEIIGRAAQGSNPSGVAQALAQYLGALNPIIRQVLWFGTPTILCALAYKLFKLLFPGRS